MSPAPAGLAEGGALARWHLGAIDKGVVELSELEPTNHHSDLRVLAMLGWWLLSVRHDLSGWIVRTPPVGSPGWLTLARSGILVSAHIRGCRIVDPDGKESELFSAPQTRLPGADWAVLDDALAADDRLRIIPDLADPRRATGVPAEDRFVFPWLTRLGLASPAITAADYPQFLADADLVLSELVDNVHRWSRARSAYVVVSTTRGSSRSGGWNRLHLVIADSGIGIPQALRRDVHALSAVYEASGESREITALDDRDLVELLLLHAYHARRVPHHDGQGLHVTQVRSSRWVGTMDLVTVDSTNKPFRTTSRGPTFEREDLPGLRGASGTLIHVLLQAASEQHHPEAAEYEQLSFAVDDDPRLAGLAS